MILSPYKRELIAHAVIKVLLARFTSFPEMSETVRNAPFHEAFLKAFQNRLSNRVSDVGDLITLSSWMQGLNTSLGQSFFESVAQILCDGEKRKFSGKEIFESQLNTINERIVDLKNGTKVPSLEKEDEMLMQNASGLKVAAQNFTADCFFETEDQVVAIELKSVRPNSGEMRGEKIKILQAKAVLKGLYPQKKVSYFFGFPFDPTSSNSTGYDKLRFIDSLVEGKRFLDTSEILIADEFWSFLANEKEGVMAEILEIINKIATPQFMEKYEVIQEVSFKGMTPDCMEILRDWGLISEIKIWENKNKFSSTSHKRIFQQQPFKKGEYNTRRIDLLMALKSLHH